MQDEPAGAEPAAEGHVEPSVGESHLGPNTLRSQERAEETSETSTRMHFSPRTRTCEMRTQVGSLTSWELGSREAPGVEETVKTLLPFDKVHVTGTHSPPGSWQRHLQKYSEPAQCSTWNQDGISATCCSSTWPKRRQSSSRAASTCPKQSSLFSAGEPKAGSCQVWHGRGNVNCIATHEQQARDPMGHDSRTRLAETCGASDENPSSKLGRVKQGEAIRADGMHPQVDGRRWGRRPPLTTPRRTSAHMPWPGFSGGKNRSCGGGIEGAPSLTRVCNK